MKYERKPDGSLWGRRELPAQEGLELVAKAEGIRHERTGPHAKVTLGLGNRRLAYNTFNVTRDEDRTRLAGSAHNTLSGAIAKDLPKQEIKAFLDEFCADLWEEFVGTIEVERVEGCLDIPTARFLLEPYIIDGAGTLLGGPPKRGKSYAGKAMAITLDAGIESPFGRALEPVPTLYVNLERSRDSIRARLARVNRALGLPERRPLRVINRRGARLVDVADRIAKAIREEGIRAIVYDSLSRSGKGSMVEDAVANQIMDVLNGFGVAWLAIGHMSRQSEEEQQDGKPGHIFGSQMFTAAADIEVAMLTERHDRENKLTVGLKVVSANDIAYPPPRYLTYEFGPEGLETIRPARDDEFGIISAGDMTPQEAVRSYLEQVGKASASEIAEELNLSRNTVVSTLRRHSKEFVRLPKERNNKVPYAVRVENAPGRGVAVQQSATPAVSGSKSGGGVAVQQPVQQSQGRLGCHRCGGEITAYTPAGQPVCGDHYEESA